MTPREKAILRGLIEATIPNCDECKRPAHIVFLPRSDKHKIGNLCLSKECLGDMRSKKGPGDAVEMSFSVALEAAEDLL